MKNRSAVRPKNYSRPGRREQLASMPDLKAPTVEDFDWEIAEAVREAHLGLRHSCIDWQWAQGKSPPHCRRNRSCGAMVPDSCPLAALRAEH